MAKRKFSKNLLIVCEGTKTEPDYFRFIAEKISFPNEIWTNIEISDNKTIPNDIPIQAKTILRNPQKRQFVNLNTRKDYDRNILKELYIDIYGVSEGTSKYEEVSAVPLRYVAQAQLIEQRTQLYDDLWAVFDKNGHSYHDEAYQRAKLVVNNKIVNIGFSSRSFEQWILLHFERSKIAFTKTECKDRKGIPLGCNEVNGCKGSICLIGHIRKNTVLKNYAKSNKKNDLKGLMKILLSEVKLQSAFENSEWLRHKMQGELRKCGGRIYELNPYTDVDFLVRNLLAYEKQFIWADFDRIVKFEGLEIKLKKINTDFIEIEIIKSLPLKNFQFYFKSKQNHSKSFIETQIVENKINIVLIKDFLETDFCIEKGTKILMFEL